MSDVLDKISLYMEDGQLLVENQASSPRAAPLHPEYDYGFILDELDDFEFRSSDAFRISKENKEIVRQTLPWWENKTLKARAVSMQTKEALEDRSVEVLGWQGNITSEEGHIVPDYENVLKKGFTGLLQEVKELMPHFHAVNMGDCPMATARILSLVKSGSSGFLVSLLRLLLILIIQKDHIVTKGNLLQKLIFLPKTMEIAGSFFL